MWSFANIHGDAHSYSTRDVFTSNKYMYMYIAKSGHRYQFHDIITSSRYKYLSTSSNVYTSPDKCLQS